MPSAAFPGVLAIEPPLPTTGGSLHDNQKAKRKDWPHMVRFEPQKRTGRSPPVKKLASSSGPVMTPSHHSGPLPVMRVQILEYIWFKDLKLTVCSEPEILPLVCGTNRETTQPGPFGELRPQTGQSPLNANPSLYSLRYNNPLCWICWLASASTMYGMTGSAPYPLVATA